MYILSRFFLYMIWPLTSVIETQIMQRVYHTNPNENMKKSELRDSIDASQQSLERSELEMTGKNSLRDKVVQ